MFEKLFYSNLRISLLITSMHSLNSKLKGIQDCLLVHECILHIQSDIIPYIWGFSCVTKFGIMRKMCSIFNLDQSFMHFKKFLIEKNLQDIISTYSIICDLIEIHLKKVKIRSFLTKIMGYSVYYQKDHINL